MNVVWGKIKHRTGNSTTETRPSPHGICLEYSASIVSPTSPNRSREPLYNPGVRVGEAQRHLYASDTDSSMQEMVNSSDSSDGESIFHFEEPPLKYKPFVEIWSSTSCETAGVFSRFCHR